MQKVDKMLHIILTFIITNLNNTTAPWNITLPTNPANFPNILLANFPWFFPFITFVLTALSSYVLILKSGVETRTSLLIISFAYTVLTYVEVLGSLTNIGYFFTFEVITLITLYVITLFVGPGEK